VVVMGEGVVVRPEPGDLAQEHPKCGLRNCMKVRFMRPVVVFPGSGKSEMKLGEMRAPEA
jgi:hypothetical protein